MAYLATQVASLYAALDYIDDALQRQPEDARGSLGGWLPTQETPVEFAYNTVSIVYEALDRYLEGEVMQWLAQDPEHWPIFRLTLLDPWRKKSGKWRKGRPGWVMMLATNTVFAHNQQDPFGRQQPMGEWLSPQSDEDDA